MTNGTVATFNLSYPAATRPTRPRPSSRTGFTKRRAGGIIPVGLNYNAGGTAISLASAISSPTTSTSSRTRQRIRPSPASVLPPCATGCPGCVTKRTTDRARRIRSPTTFSASTPRFPRSPDGCSTTSGTWASTRTITAQWAGKCSTATCSGSRQAAVSG